MGSGALATCLEERSGGNPLGAVAGAGGADAIDDEVTANGTIRRSWLRRLANGDPVIFLAATIVWGFGSFSRGPRFLRAMLVERRSDQDVGTVTASIVEASRRSPAEGFSSLFDGRGRSRVSHLGIAFGTKVVHFAGYDHVTPRPLVLDKRVWAGGTALEGRAPIPDPARYTKGDEYQGYCAWAAAVAADMSVEAALVKYALFQYGRSLRRR